MLHPGNHGAPVEALGASCFVGPRQKRFHPSLWSRKDLKALRQASGQEKVCTARVWGGWVGGGGDGGDGGDEWVGSREGLW